VRLPEPLTRFLPASSPLRFAVLGLAAWFALVLAYAGYVDQGTVTRDQWEFLPLLDRFLSGDMDWGQLWNSHSEHVKPGYKLLFLLNGKYFGLDLMLEIWTGLFLLGLTVWVTARELHRSFNGAGGPVWLPAFTLFSAGVVLMSFNQWANYIYSLLALGGFAGTLLQVGFMAGFSRALREDVRPARMAGLALVALLAVLGFAGARSPAMAGACAAALALAWWLEPGARARLLRGALPLLGLGILAIALYFHLLYSHNEKLQRVGNDLSVVLTHPIGAVAYLSRMLAESQFDIGHALYFVNGALLHAIYGVLGYAMLAWALWRYFASRLWQKSWLPLLLVLYSALFALEVLLGRYGLADRAVDDAVAPRYVFDSHLWIVGVVWIAGLEWSRHWDEMELARWRRLAPAAVFAVMLVTETMDAGGTLLIAHRQHVNQAAGTQFLIDVMGGQADLEDAEPWVCPHPVVCTPGLAILKRRQLNFARALPVEAPAASTNP
jgi:hypothetical protein